MTAFRIVAALAMVVLIALVLTDPVLASTHVWIAVGPPSTLPLPGSTFTTDLNISSWDGAAGALDLTVHYDPSVVEIVDFSTNPDSEFHPNCFADSASFDSGETRIACFQVTNWETLENPVAFSTLTWKAVGAVGSSTDISIEPTAVVAAEWDSVEVFAYGQHIVVLRAVYLPLTMRSHSGSHSGADEAGADDMPSEKSAAPDSALASAKPALHVWEGSTLTDVALRTKGQAASDRETVGGQGEAISASNPRNVDIRTMVGLGALMLTGLLGYRFVFSRTLNG
jgi:hypothetical protein